IHLAALLAVFGVLAAAAGEIVCEKQDFAGHLQGIVADASGIYWSFYDSVIKNDYTGRIIASVKAPRHTGDPCIAEGRICVPIILYDREDIKREGGTGWVYVYDTDLKCLSKTARPETPRPGAMTFFDGKFYIAGSDFGKKPHPVNPIYIYDRELKFERKVIVDIGTPTQYGAQTLNVADGKILAAFYAKARGSVLLSVPDLKVEKEFPTSLSVGFAFVPPEFSGGRRLVLIARKTGKRGAHGAKLLIREWRDDKLFNAELAKR
ncbi:MAG: hypothetical protein IJJ28_04760, partial [Lentisphaeria bacterium]|nr:hypothetical protein [Lentisphaeria bacterium]